MPKFISGLKIMPKSISDPRRTGKNKRRQTFNRYGKNTARGLRHIVSQKQARQNKQKIVPKKKN